MPIHRQFYQHFLNCTKHISLMKDSKMPKEKDPVFSSKIIYLPPLKSKKTKTLILDLDETLIHCSQDSKAPADMKIPIQVSDEKIVEAGLYIRPHSDKFLKEMSKIYEIVIFTSSHPTYANRVLNILDPNNEVITSRVFREHCTATEDGILVKDLRIFANRDLKNVVLVDNSILNYSYQLFNGIPILPFYGNK